MNSNPLDRVLYERKTLAKIAEEAAKEDTIFSLNDRMGLVYDIVALSSAGLAKVSSALTLLSILGKTEKECQSNTEGHSCWINVILVDLVWANIAENLATFISAWWENEQIVDKLNALRGVRVRCLRTDLSGLSIP
jgi:aminopeptidase 2